MAYQVLYNKRNMCHSDDQLVYGRVWWWSLCFSLYSWHLCLKIKKQSLRQNLQQVFKFCIYPPRDRNHRPYRGHIYQLGIDELYQKWYLYAKLFIVIIPNATCFILFFLRIVTSYLLSNQAVLKAVLWCNAWKKVLIKNCCQHRTFKTLLIFVSLSLFSLNFL